MTTVRVRLSPWRLRWRGRGSDAAGDLAGLLDDPVLAVLALLLLPLVGVGVLLMGGELLVLLVVTLLLLVCRAVGLLTWTLEVTDPDGSRSLVRVRGTRALLRRRRELLRR